MKEQGFCSFFYPETIKMQNRIIYSNFYEKLKAAVDWKIQVKRMKKGKKNEN